MVIKAFLIIVVAAFYLAVMSWGTGTYLLMEDSKLPAQDIQRVLAVGLCQMGKFRTVIGL